MACQKSFLFLNAMQVLRQHALLGRIHSLSVVTGETLRSRQVASVTSIVVCRTDHQLAVFEPRTSKGERRSLRRERRVASTDRRGADDVATLVRRRTDPAGKVARDDLGRTSPF
jgi:type VI protein secretion system component VasA